MEGLILELKEIVQNLSEKLNKSYFEERKSYDRLLNNLKHSENTTLNYDNDKIVNENKFKESIVDEYENFESIKTDNFTIIDNNLEINKSEKKNEKFIETIEEDVEWSTEPISDASRQSTKLTVSAMHHQKTHAKCSRRKKRGSNLKSENFWEMRKFYSSRPITNHKSLNLFVTIDNQPQINVKVWSRQKWSDYLLENCLVGRVIFHNYDFFYFICRNLSELGSSWINQTSGRLSIVRMRSKLQFYNFNLKFCFRTEQAAV